MVCHLADRQVSVVVQDENGVQLGSGSINLNASGHDSRFLEDMFPLAANRVGIVRFQTSNSLITGIGLRFSSTGSFTSVPIAR